MQKKKSLGQHFLQSARIAARIADAAHLSKRDTAVEVGPGEGMLTRELLSRADRVITIEKDRRLIAPLREQFAREIADGRLELVEADALNFNPTNYGLRSVNYVVVANIPYYITGALIETFLSARVLPTRMVLLVQKEVAERIAKEKKGSVLSMSVRAYGVPSYMQTVPAKHFSPKPTVDSAILLIDDISRVRFKDVSEKHFFSVLKTGFAHKRKRLAGNLREHFGERAVISAFGTLDLSQNMRAEDMSIEQWFALSKTLLA